MRCRVTDDSLKQRFTQPLIIRAARRAIIVAAGLVVALADAGGRGGAAPAADNPSIYALARKAVTTGRTAKTEQVGFTIGRAFRETPTEGAVLIGFIFGVGKSNQVEAVY